MGGAGARGSTRGRLRSRPAPRLAASGTIASIAGPPMRTPADGTGSPEPAMANPPTGTVTFLFTDIEGSTKRWEHLPAAMAAALVTHDRLLRAAIEAREGHVFKTVGDAFCAAFVDPTAALAAALAAQRALAAEAWDE